MGAAQKSPDLFQNYTPPGSGNYALTNLNGIQYISIVDERNRRGRPPKSKKPPELEAKERDFKELREKELREKDPNGEDEHGHDNGGTVKGGEGNGTRVGRRNENGPRKGTERRVRLLFI